MDHKRDAKPAIRVEVKETIMKRIIEGPLKATGGKGAAPWVRQLIIRELDEWELTHKESRRPSAETLVSSIAAHQK